ncbi:hypothetical protein GUY60_34755 [Streptomyces sp. YC537]|uniref:Uncharacterized protein n=1 Tax=Streptomyces boluensis TaxID=1775135 RepID=A0A964UXG3_9ACTN|nr:hypothetical protein [Streptomyces boluensis]
MLVFTGGPQPAAVPVEELAAQGIRVSEPTTHDADTAFPLTLTAHPDEGGGLVLTVAHDPARLRDADALLADVVGLLRQLPGRGDQYTTARAFLAELREPVTRDSDTGPLLRELRAGAGESGAVVCLVPAPGVLSARYERLALNYAGPEPLALLEQGEWSAEAQLAALAPLLGPERRLVLGGFSGGGAAAYELAQLVARTGGRPPLVVLAAAATPDADLARTLAAAAARAG